MSPKARNRLLGRYGVPALGRAAAGTQAGLHASAERTLDNQARFLKFMQGFKFQLSKKGGACAH